MGIIKNQKLNQDMIATLEDKKKVNYYDYVLRTMELLSLEGYRSADEVAKLDFKNKLRGLSKKRFTEELKNDKFRQIVELYLKKGITKWH